MASASSVPLEPPSPSLSLSSPALNVPAPAFERVATELEPAQLPTRPAVECAPHAEPVRGDAVDMGVGICRVLGSDRCVREAGALGRRRGRDDQFRGRAGRRVKKAGSGAYFSG